MSFPKLNLNSFEIIKEIGRGSSGRVYKSIDNKTKKECVFKFIRINTSNSNNLHLEIEPVLQEKEMLEKLSQTNNPAFLNFKGIYESNENSAEKYIILSMESGLASLYEVLNMRTNYSENEILYIINGLIEGFCEAQMIGISHRDIKPDNIILCKNEQNEYIYKISDFGSGFYLKKDEISLDHELIEAQTIKTLSRLYAAPELKDSIIGDSEFELTHNFLYNPYKADVFSLGVVVLRMMGFHVNKVKKILLSLRQKPVKIKGFKKISYLLSHMLVIEPEHRFSFHLLKKLLKTIGSAEKPEEQLVIQELIKRKRKEFNEDIGSIEKSEEPLVIQEQEIRRKQREINEISENRFKTMQNLIRVLYHQLKDYDVCRAFVNKALESFNKDTQISRDLKKKQAFWIEWLAAIEYKQGNYDNSLKIYKEALKIQKNIFGKEALHISSIKSNQAYIYEQIGDITKALNSMKKCLEILKITYGENHNKIIKCLGKIASFYEKLKDFPNSFKTYDNLIMIRKKIYGEKDKKLAIYINNLAVLYMKYGDKNKALEHHLEANKILSNYFKESYKEIAISYSNIAQIYTDLSDYSNSQIYTEKVLVIYLNIFGKNHENTAECLRSLAHNYRYLKDLNKALEISKESYDILKLLYGEKHENTLLSLMCIGQIYQEMTDYEKALENYMDCLKVFKEIYGEFNLKTANCFNNIALIYKYMGEYSKAFNFIQKALNIYITIYEDIHVNTAICYYNVGLILQEIKDFPLAIENYQKALELFKKLFGENNVNIANCMNCIAECYRKAGILSKALSYFNEILSISNDTAIISKIKANLGLIYFQNADYEAARKHQINLLKNNISLYGENHHETLVALNQLANTERKDKKHEKALILYSKARNISLKINGSNHSLTIAFYKEIKRVKSMINEKIG